MMPHPHGPGTPAPRRGNPAPAPCYRAVSRPPERAAASRPPGPLGLPGLLGLLGLPGPPGLPGLLGLPWPPRPLPRAGAAARARAACARRSAAGRRRLPERQARRLTGLRAGQGRGRCRGCPSPSPYRSPSPPPPCCQLKLECSTTCSILSAPTDTPRPRAQRPPAVRSQRTSGQPPWRQEAGGQRSQCPRQANAGARRRSPAIAGGRAGDCSAGGGRRLLTG
jgi:hypothetical protein